MRKLGLLVLVVLLGAAPGKADGPLSDVQVQQLRREISATFFVPDPLPALDAHTYRTFNPAPGVRAEALTYTTQLGARVPAILYLPEPLPKTKIPAFVVVNGHAGDKYCWYSYYTGILFAHGGAAVLTYDQAGEGERNPDHKSGTRAHDQIQGDAVVARHLAGLMITDVMQAVSYLSQRPEVDARRIVVGGYSLGSFVVAITGAVDPRIRACVLVGGGDLDGPGGCWDQSRKLMCQALPYQSLNFLGDRPAVIYALHAARGPTLVYNGLGDTMVAIPNHTGIFFKDLQDRVARLHGGTNDILDVGFAPANCGHRPYWLTRPVVSWLEQQIDFFPNWTGAGIGVMPETKISQWSDHYGIFIDKDFTAELREGGMLALGNDVPGYSRDGLNVFTPETWARQKTNFILETWLKAVRRDTNNPSMSSLQISP